LAGDEGFECFSSAELNVQIYHQLAYTNCMFRKVSGDVRHGYVESAWARFEILGDRDGTLAALRRGSERANYPSIEIQPETRANFVAFNTIHGLGMVAAKYV
jgi:hypothetical protein